MNPKDFKESKTETKAEKHNRIFKDYNNGVINLGMIIDSMFMHVPNKDWGKVVELRKEINDKIYDAIEKFSV